MKLKSLLTAAMFCAAPMFAGSSLTLPFNTGVNASGSIAAPGSNDIHWSTNAGQPVYAASTYACGWVGADSASTWITPDGINGSTVNHGVYELDYYTTFYIPTGVDPSTVKLTGLVAADDLLEDIRVNGLSSHTYVPYAYETFTPFTLDQGFQTGRNTLDFLFENTGGPGGLRVEWTGVTTGCDPTATPEPASIALLGFGVAGLGLIRRTIKK